VGVTRKTIGINPRVAQTKGKATEGDVLKRKRDFSEGCFGRYFGAFTRKDQRRRIPIHK